MMRHTSPEPQRRMSLGEWCAASTAGSVDNVKLGRWRG